MNTTTGAQRHNARQDKIWEACKRAKQTADQSQNREKRQRFIEKYGVTGGTLESRAQGKPEHSPPSPLQVLESVKDMLTGDQLASIGFYDVEELIVASVNHAEALAEALDMALIRIGRDEPGMVADMARQALADWTKANESR